MKYGLIGENIDYSFSKEIHEKLFDYEYELKTLNNSEFHSFMKDREFSAINVTIPYKETVLPYLDYIDDISKEIGSVNTIVNRNGKLFGYNTDYYGLKSLIEFNQIDFAGKKVLILGSGGTSKTAVYVASELGAIRILRVSRSNKDGFITYEDAISYLNDTDIIINTTPCGTKSFPDEIAIDINCFSNLFAVIDVVYNPIRTKIVCDALNKGIKAVGGLYMLVAQAVFASEKFVDKPVSKDKITELYNEIYNQKQNVVLIGMPSSGKTTIGKILSERMKRDFVDTDEQILENCGKTPFQIITERGEEAFREQECVAIKRIAELQGRVISTGGGAILRKGNIDSLRKNGRIYFIDRDVERLIPTENRPFSSNYEDLKTIYKERYNRYLSVADCRVENNSSIEDAVERISEDFNL